jgi:hypothetical protein
MEIGTDAPPTALTTTTGTDAPPMAVAPVKTEISTQTYDKTFNETVTDACEETHDERRNSISFHGFARSGAMVDPLDSAHGLTELMNCIDHECYTDTATT